MLLLMVFTLVFGCSFGILAADYALYLDSKGVVHQNTATGAATTVNGLSYSGGKWIMNGVNFSSSQPVAMTIEGNATIELAKASQNIISSTNTDTAQKNNIALKALGTLTVNGNGTLALTAKAAEQSFALYSTGSLTVKDATIHLISGAAGGFSYGAYVTNGNLSAADCRIVAQSGNAGQVSAAISVDNRTADNKQFNATAISATDSDFFVMSGNVISNTTGAAASYGIYANNGNIDFNDGCEINATAGKIELTQSYGPAYSMGICIAPDNKLGNLTAKGSTKIFCQGGSVTVNTAIVPSGKTASAHSAGLATYGNINLDCAKAFCLGSNSTLRSDGIYSAGGTLTVANGTVKGITGNQCTSGNGIFSKAGINATGGYSVGICFHNESGIAGDKFTLGSTMAITVLSTPTIKNGKVYQGSALAKKVNITAKCKGDKNCPSYKFADVNKTAWYHYDIDFAITKKLVNGTSTTTFSPDTSTTREQLVALIYRMEGSPAVSPELIKAAPFTDLTNEWSKSAIVWANAKGIVSGYEDKTFRPGNAVTRQEMAVILYHYANSKTPNPYDTSLKASLDSYPDKSAVATWGTEAIQWAIANSLLSGSSVGGVSYLRPGGNTTRAQIAAVLHRFYDRYVY